MKGQTINFRKKDGSWVSGFFIPDTSTQVSLNSRKYYNFCRNDSSSVRNVLAWDSCPEEDINYVRYRNVCRHGEMSRTVGGEAHQYDQYDAIYEDTNRMVESMRERPASSTDQLTPKISLKSYVEKERERSLERPENTALKEVPTRQENPSPPAQKPKRPQSARPDVVARNDAIIEQARKNRQAKIAKLRMKKQKSADRLKVQQYVKSLVPYTRDLSNTRFRSYYGKECMQMYGKNNTNEPIGGIIYGNHLKTFNIGPHSRGNDPRHYQTHNTALNFAKRTKLNEEDNWRRLEKEMGKKLGLQLANNSIKEGKELNVLEVNDDNMYAVMKDNHEFQKQHGQEIRELEKEQRKDKIAVMRAEAEEYKQQRVVDREAFKMAPLPAKSDSGEASTAFDNMSVEERMKSQVIYKYTDENGVTRYATDRHAITCYVDTNFPENDEAYTQELINRSPIFPIEVKEKDRHLDEIRKDNYYDSVVNCYPAHYLIPNVDYSQVKWGRHAREQERNRSKSRSKSKSLGRHPVKNQQALPRGQPAYDQALPRGRPAQQSQPIPRRRSDQAPQPIPRNKSPGINEVRNQQQLAQQRQVQFADQIQRDEQMLRRRQQQQQYQAEAFGSKRSQQYIRRSDEFDEEYGERCGCISARPGCAPDIKQVLLERAQRDPQLASKLLSYSKKYDCELNNNQPTTLIENNVYDPNNYYPHAIHELNPQLYSRASPERIPYAGLPSTAVRERIP